jgi:hypothetical protein
VNRGGGSSGGGGSFAIAICDLKCVVLRSQTVTSKRDERDDCKKAHPLLCGCCMCRSLVGLNVSWRTRLDTMLKHNLD